MLKIPKSAIIARRLGIALLPALAIILPCGASTPPTLNTLYSFTGQGDGAAPEAGLVMSSGGELFGTTEYGGASGWGTVYEMIPGKGGVWTEKTLYSFTGEADGANPISKLVITANNVLYGTTYYGGANGDGVVFELAPKTGGVWKQTVLYSFAGGNDGANPSAGLLLSGTSVLYGTTYGGGSGGVGTVFELALSKGVWTETVLYSFQGGTGGTNPLDGANPFADLAINGSGSLFGTTLQGGTGTNGSGWGTVFELTKGTGGAWTESVLYAFSGGSDGGAPESALIIGTGGVLYGSTFWGGTPMSCVEGGYPQGCGTIFELAAPVGGGTPWTETVLHTFSGKSPDGAHPYQDMVLSTAGILFGTTYSGGVTSDVCLPDSYDGCGTLYLMKPPATPGGKWVKSNVTVFQGTPSGGVPNGIVQAKSGYLFGTTIVGGSEGGYGTVFMTKP
jgi:uncharacterized repeat protein (TIGR03803 family)